MLGAPGTVAVAVGWEAEPPAVAHYAWPGVALSSPGGTVVGAETVLATGTGSLVIDEEYGEEPGCCGNLQPARPSLRLHDWPPMTRDLAVVSSRRLRTWT